MSAIKHHIPDSILTAYAAGSLPHAFSVVVASHVSMCDTCRAGLSADYAVGAAVMERVKPSPVAPALRDRVLEQLDDPVVPSPVFERDGVYPAPVMAALKGRPLRWRRLGMGVQQDVLYRDTEGAVRLLYIPGGQAVPEHSHNGLEMTLVLQGSFSDATGAFGVGDLEIADQDLEHIPVADPGPPCICLAATDARLRFNALVPRMLQPLFGI